MSSPVSYKPVSPLVQRQRRLDAIRLLPGQISKQGVERAVGALLLGRRPAGILGEQWDVTAKIVHDDLVHNRMIAGDRLTLAAEVEADLDHGHLQLHGNAVKAVADYAEKLTATDIPERLLTFCDEVTVGHWRFHAPAVNAVDMGETGIGW